MRTRETHINIRTTPQEKSKIERNAKRCGLSLSEYLRKLASGYEPKELPSFEYEELMRTIYDLYADFHETGDSQYADLLARVLLDLQAAISPAQMRCRDGNHKNLAGS